MSKLIIFFTIVIVFSCDKEDEIPNFPFNIYIPLNDPEYVDLKIPGNFKYIEGGVCGIIVVNKGNDEFSSIERCCPYKVEQKNKVYVDTSNYNIYCPVCNSKYNYYDGGFINGVSKKSLRNYKTIYIKDKEMLEIYN